MKLLSLQYHVYPDAIGGAWKVTHELNRRLVQREHTVHTITCKPDEKLSDIECLEGIHLHRIPFASSKNVWKLAKELWKRIGELCNGNSFDIIHIHNPLIGFLALLHPSLWKIPVVYHFHSAWFDEEKINRKAEDKSGGIQGVFGQFLLLAVRLMEWYCYFRSNQILMLSDYSLRRFRRFFPFYGAQAKIIPGGVDVGEFRPAENVQEKRKLREQLQLPSDLPILLTVRRLHYRMGLESLIQALAQIEDIAQPPKYLFLIAGEGPLQEQLSRQINEFGLNDKVRLTGALGQEILPLYYRSADAFILPTAKIEGFGLSTAEALASGLPVIGTPVGATQNILGTIDPKLLFDGTDPESLSKGILEYLNNRQMYSELSAACREKAVSQYSWEGAADQTETLFLELIKARKK